MRYSAKCLDKALGLILSDYDTWKKHVNTPSSLNIAAKVIFLYPERFQGVNESFAVCVIRTALYELDSTACLETGDVDGFWA